MDERGNLSTLASGYVITPPGYWAGIVFYFLSIFFNVTFIYVTSKGDVRNKSADHTLRVLCCVQICSAISMIVKTTLLFEERTALIHSLVFRLFETLEFLFKGIYIALLLILHTTRFIVMRNICTIQNINNRVQNSKLLQVVVSLIVLLLSCIHGTVSILKMPMSSYNIMTYILHGIVIGLPWVFFLVLHSVMVINTVFIIYKRKRKNVVSMATEGRSITRGPVLADKLFQQVATLLVFQTLFIVIPFTYTIAVELVLVYSKVEARFDTFTCIVKSVLPFLNPVGLGIFLKQRRDELVSFLGVRNITNSRRTTVFENDYWRSNQDEHASCQKNLQDVSLPESLKCDLNPGEMLLSDQLSQPRIFFTSNNGGASLGHKRYPDTWSHPNDTYIERDIDIESISEFSDMSSLYYSSCSNYNTLAMKRPPYSEETPMHSIISFSAENIGSAYSQESATTSVNEANAWKYVSPMYQNFRTKHTPNSRCRSDSISSMLSVVSTIENAISFC